MQLEDARKMVAEALEQRRKFGKHFTVADMPPEFLDALVIVHSAPSGAESEATSTIAKLVTERDEQHEEIVLLRRQLGAAKSRETKLRKDLAERDDTIHSMRK